MPLSPNRPLAEESVTVPMTDSGTASTVYIGAPFKGYVRRIMVTLGATPVTVANNTFTGKIAGNNITHDALVQPFTGSAAGQVVSAACTSANWVDEGQTISVASDGAGSSVTPSAITVVIERH